MFKALYFPMMQLPFIPETAPFTPEQRAWLNGFLAGLFSQVAARLCARTATQRRTGSQCRAVTGPVRFADRQRGRSRQTGREGSADARLCTKSSCVERLRAGESDGRRQGGHHLQHLGRRRSAGQCGEFLVMAQRRYRATAGEFEFRRARSWRQKLFRLLRRVEEVRCPSRSARGETSRPAR